MCRQQVCTASSMKSEPSKSHRMAVSRAATIAPTAGMRNKVASLMVRFKPNRETEKWRARTFKSKGDNKSVRGGRAILYPAISFPMTRLRLRAVMDKGRCAMRATWSNGILRFWSQPMRRGRSLSLGLAAKSKVSMQRRSGVGVASGECTGRSKVGRAKRKGKAWRRDLTWSVDMRQGA